MVLRLKLPVAQNWEASVVKAKTSDAKVFSTNWASLDPGDLAGSVGWNRERRPISFPDRTEKLSMEKRTG